MKTSPNGATLKSSTNASRKVIPQRRSLPACKKKTATPATTKSVSKQKYKDPLPLGDLSPIGGGTKSGEGHTAATNTTKMVSDSVYKPGVGKYVGTLNLGSLS